MERFDVKFLRNMVLDISNVSDSTIVAKVL